MNVERTIEFILQSQARAETRLAKAEARAAKTDKRIDAIAKLVRQGMRMMVESKQDHTALRSDMRQLAQAQKATERSLKSFIDSLRHGRNGRNGR